MASAFSAQFEGAKALLDAASLEDGRKRQSADNSQVLSSTVQQFMAALISGAALWSQLLGRLCRPRRKASFQQGPLLRRRLPQRGYAGKIAMLRNCVRASLDDVLLYLREGIIGGFHDWLTAPQVRRFRLRSVPVRGVLLLRIAGPQENAHECNGVKLKPWFEYVEYPWYFFSMESSRFACSPM